jgi:hypothetical protein
MSAPKKIVTDYLASLTWDGTPRIDRWLVEYAGAADTPHTRAVSRAVLVAAVRRARQPGCKLDEMLVVEGPQGAGKSAAVRILAVHDDWYADDSLVGASSREIVEATAGKWIVEISELQRMGAGDVAALKAFVSARNDSSREPYQRVSASVPRSFVVVGTTAETEYLPDPTGNRRFWTVRVERFDLDRLRADRDQLWAEAAAAETAGEPIRVPDEVAADADASTVADRGASDKTRRILDFLMKEWGRKDSRQLVAVELLYATGLDHRDESIQRWERADEPEFFAAAENVEMLAEHIVAIAEEEADAKPAGKHRFVVRAHQYAGTKPMMSFAVLPAHLREHDEEPKTVVADGGAAYVVVSDGFGVEFSSPNLDAACAYVSDKLRRQADETVLVNPSSYRIKRVPTA